MATRLGRRALRKGAVFTATPHPSPPNLVCPTCHLPLEYRQSVLSGVKPDERWDLFR